MVPVSLAVAKVNPSGENLRQLTAPSCVFKLHKNSMCVGRPPRISGGVCVEVGVDVDVLLVLLAVVALLVLAALAVFHTTFHKCTSLELPAVAKTYEGIM